MRKNLFIITAIFGILLAGWDCNQSEPEQQNSQEQSKPITTVTTVAGTKISASSLSELQTTINNTDAGSVIDLSQCSGISGTLTIDKSLTVRNYSNLSSDLIITDANVTLTGMTVNSVTTQQSGSSGLKIANSSLSTLTLGGDGINASQTVVSRSVSSPKVSLIGSTVSDTVTFKESVEMDVIGFDANINRFACTQNVQVTVNMTPSACGEAKPVDGITFTQSISDDKVYAELETYGPAGRSVTYTSSDFPADAVTYTGDLVRAYVSDIGNFPIPTFEVGSEFTYQMMTENDIPGIGEIKKTMKTFAFRALNVAFPKGAKEWDSSDYKESLDKAGFEFSNDDNAYIKTNFIDPSNSEIASSADALSMLNDMKDKIYYRLEVEVTEEELIFMSCVMQLDIDSIMNLSSD
ncbi:MAG: hypothetical protein IKP67_01450 [Spirochaetales bacterium]|nr:hypothetical protein [Spirochaetales bacterium]